MFRCVMPAFALAIAGLFAAPATAQIPRRFPATALRGTFIVSQPPTVLLNGRPARLAPGARIRGTNNLIQLSGSLVNQRLVVNYTTDPIGLLMDVWVLTPQEAAKRPWPTTAEEAQRWRFDPLSQTWTRP